jgi:hypothetical protein
LEPLGTLETLETELDYGKDGEGGKRLHTAPLRRPKRFGSESRRHEVAVRAEFLRTGDARTDPSRIFDIACLLCPSQLSPPARLVPSALHLATAGGLVLTPSGGKGGLMTSNLRVRFWVEAGLAALCALLAILTLFTRDWIEALTGFDPDNHNGSFEWMIVAALALVCILLSIAARADWRRLRSSALAGT